MRRFVLPWSSVYASSDTAVFLPATNWMDAATVAKVKLTWEAAGFTGNLQARPALQTANVANSPQATVSLGSAYQSTAAVYYESVQDVSTSTDDYELVRFGWQVKLSSGTVLALGRIAGSGAAWDRC